MGLINRVSVRIWRTAFINLLLALLVATSTSASANTAADSWREFITRLQQPQATPSAVASARFAAASAMFKTAMPTALTSAAPTYGENAWLAMNGVPPISSNAISSAVEFNGRLYISGQGLSVGNLHRQSLIAWDGDQWFEVPSPRVVAENEQLIVSGMVLYNGELVVSTYSLDDNGLGNSALFAWNGSQWRELYKDSGNRIAIKMLAIDGGIAVLMASIDTNSNLAQISPTLWNGTAMSEMPTDDLLMGFSLATYNGQLYMGGMHYKAGGMNTTYGLVVWDGQSWQVVESSALSLPGEMIMGMVATQDGLIVYGPGSAATAFARWDGTGWTDLRSELLLPDNTFQEVVTVQEVDGRLLMVVNYQNNFGHNDQKIIVLDNGQAVVLGAQVEGPSINPLMSSYWYSFQGQLLFFSVNKISGQRFHSVAALNDTDWQALDGAKWKPLGTPGLEYINALATFNGRLAAAGNFSDSTDGVAIQEASGWQRIAQSDGEVFSLIEYQGQLIAAGEFTQIEGVAADKIAVWNGTTWEAFGGGLADALISKLFIFNSQMYAVGSGDPFDDASSALLYWDGTDWVAPGAGGSTLWPSSRINAAVEFNGQLVLGGNMRLDAAGINLPLVVWDGVTLTPLTPSLNGPFTYYDEINSLAVYEGELIVAAHLNTTPTPVMPYLSGWNGTSWRTFNDVNTNIAQVAVFDDQLMVLEQVPATSANQYSNHLLKLWDGQTLSGLTFDGGQLGFPWVDTMSVHNDLLVFTGDFLGVGITDWSSTEKAVFSPNIIGLQSSQASLTFAGEGSAGLAPIHSTVGTAVNLPDLTRDQYSFLGWNTAADGSGTSYRDTLVLPRGATTLYAEWTPVLYSLTFVTQDNAFDITSHPLGANIVAPQPADRDGYTFTGWDSPVPSTMPAQHLTFTAQWEINAYTISFVMDGGDAITPLTVTYGEPVALPTPVREGYEFLGWDLTSPATMPAQNLTFTALWQTIVQSSSSSDSSPSSSSSEATQSSSSSQTSSSSMQNSSAISSSASSQSSSASSDSVSSSSTAISSSSSAISSSASSQSSSVSSDSVSSSSTAISSSSSQTAQSSSSPGAEPGSGQGSSSSAQSSSATSTSVSSQSSSSSSSDDASSSSPATSSSSSQVTESSSSAGVEPGTSSSAGQSSAANSSAKSGGGGGGSSNVLLLVLLCAGLLARRTSKVA